MSFFFNGELVTSRSCCHRVCSYSLYITYIVLLWPCGVAGTPRMDGNTFNRPSIVYCILREGPMVSGGEGQLHNGESVG